MGDLTARAEAIRARLARVHERMAGACHRAGRNPDEVTLIAVTKTFSPEVVAAGLAAGLRDLGENKAQELSAKAPLFPGAHWHMIGHLQRNKARSVVQHAATFHALDSVRLANALNRHAQSAGRVLPCYVQINVSGEVSKFGLSPDQAEELLQRMEGYEHLKLRGLMTLAAPDPTVVRDQFRLLRRIQERYAHLGCRALSMGMSGDFEVAIEEGATHVRVGSAIFGPREQP